ncbi:MAG: hypothetical protein ABTQ32_05075 [Myxococcaceae bacterium]
MTVVRAGLAVIAAIFAGASVVLLVLAVRRALQLQRFASWRRVRATVTSMGFEARGDDLGVLRVVFDVEGRSSTLLDIGEEERRVTERARLVETFASGTTHDALVDPTGASAPILVTGLTTTPASMVFLSVVFLVPVGILLGVTWWLGQP